MHVLLMYNLNNWWLKFVKFNFSLYKICFSFRDGGVFETGWNTSLVIYCYIYFNTR